MSSASSHITENESTASRTRIAAFALAAAGVLFVLYPAIRPWHDENTVQGATTSMSSNAWTGVGLAWLALGLWRAKPAQS